MIAGIGVDTATVARIEKSIARESFYTRVYGPEERAALDALSPARRAQSAAGAWAAKEALGKALGTGLSGFVWEEAQVLHNVHGAPYFHFSGSTRRIITEEKGLTVHLSITHEGGFATAFVVLETR